MNSTTKTIGRSPTLQSVLMVERTIKKYSQEYTKHQLWQKLPKKMMWQTYLIVIDYLEESGKILIDKEGIVMWTFNPQRIRDLKQKGLMVR